MKLLIIAISILHFGLLAKAQITGTVVDENNKPIPGVNIYLKGSYEGTSTNEHGSFRFKTSLSDNQTLIASFIGYETFTKEILLNNETIKLLIKLKPESTQLNTIEITAGSFAAGDKYKSAALKPVDIATTASAEADIYGAMSTLPGAQKVGEEGMLFVRGGESYETKTFIDGLLVHNPFYSNMPNLPTRGRFSPLLFNGTVFSTGAYSAEYGQALSSVLLLNTTALAPKTESSIMLMSVGGSLSHTHKWNSSSISMNAEYQNLAPYFAIANQNIDWITPPTNVGSTIAFRQKAGETGMIKTFGAFSQNSSSLLHENLDNQTKDTISLTNTDYYINTSYNGMLSDNFMIKTGIAYNKSSEPLLYNNDKIKTDIENIVGKLVFENNFSNKFTLRYGGSISASSFDETITLEESNYELNNSFINRIYSGFIESEFQISNKLAFRTGIRNEYTDLENKNFISPRFSIAYKINETSQLSAAYGNFNQTAYKDYLKINNDLNSEISNHYIINYQYIKNDRVFRFEADDKNDDNLVKYTNEFSYTPSDYNNKGYGYSQGIDIFWRDNKSIKNGDYWISYSFNDTQRDYKDYPSLSAPTFASKHNLSVVYKQYIDKIRSMCGLTYTYSSKRPYFNPNNEIFHADYTKSYHNLSGNLTYIISANRGMKMLHLTVNNILGIDNIFSYRYSSSPNNEGQYDRLPIKQASKRLIIIGFIWTI